MPTLLAPGSLIHVFSTKYDGSPHRSHDAYLLEPYDYAEGAVLRLVVPVGTLTHTTSGGYTTDFEYEQVFWLGTECWWNVEHYPHGFTHPQRGLEFSYANVSLPAALEGDTLRWVDLDLDVIVAARGIVLKDEEEFEANAARFAYPDDLVRRAREAATTLLALAAVGAPPFDRLTMSPPG